MGFTIRTTRYRIQAGEQKMDRNRTMLKFCCWLFKDETKVTAEEIMLEEWEKETAADEYVARHVVPTQGGVSLVWVEAITEDGTSLGEPILWRVEQGLFLGLFTYYKTVKISKEDAEQELKEIGWKREKMVWGNHDRN